MCKIAEIALNLPLNKTFHYEIPEHFKKLVQKGKRVTVPFGNRIQSGIIVGFCDKSDVEHVKPILDIKDESPLIDDDLFMLAGWISDNYFCSLGEALSAMTPYVVKKFTKSIKKSTEDKKLEIDPDFVKPFLLNSEQKKAFDEISKHINDKKHKTFLLHGITSSGKTEIYLQTIEVALKKGLSSIVLVPEISLTPQTVLRFVSRFGDKVAVVHSRLKGSKRYSEWMKIKQGKAKIVIGARSAIFSPVKNLGLIVIDEEHETSYKQEDVPRYHARDVAVKRGDIAGCPVILGSATPSVESYFKSHNGEYRLLKLAKRIDNRNLPKVKVVDMRLEVATRKRLVMFSKMFIDAVRETIEKKQQVIVFLNRRGFATYINCKSCGHVMKCKSCDAIMVYHFDKKKLICHYCNKTIPPPNICPKCNKNYIKYFGVGTQRVESELSRNIPQAKIVRMDQDSTSKRGSHDDILDSFKRHKVDILIGTQMIAKGLDFPNVTLVGAVNSDVTLNLPDFRASERTFNLITQVAGRAGRGKDEGLVIVQTYAPGHYAIMSASKHDYETFFKEELKTRKEMQFPPFTHLVRLTLRSKNQGRVEDAAKNIYNSFRARLPEEINIIGPAPAPISRLRGYYRWNIILKHENRMYITKHLTDFFAEIKKPSGVFIAVDTDPISV